MKSLGFFGFDVAVKIPALLAIIHPTFSVISLLGAVGRYADAVSMLFSLPTDITCHTLGGHKEVVKPRDTYVYAI